MQSKIPVFFFWERERKKAARHRAASGRFAGRQRRSSKRATSSARWSGVGTAAFPSINALNGRRRKSSLNSARHHTRPVPLKRAAAKGWRRRRRRRSDSSATLLVVISRVFVTVRFSKKKIHLPRRAPGEGDDAGRCRQTNTPQKSR